MEQLNELAKQQETLGIDIKTDLTNWKKDSPDRKSKEYIQKRLTSLEERWGKIQENDVKIKQLKLDHNYVTSKYYEQLEKLYNDAKSYLKTCRKAETAGKSTTKEEESQAQRLKLQKIRMELMYEILKKADEEMRPEIPKDNLKYELLLSRMEELRHDISKLNEQILMNEKQHTDEYFVNKKYSDMECAYESTWLRMKRALINNDSTPSIDRSSAIRLPELKIPLYDGNYENWQNFQDLFLRVIHNNPTLSKVEKLQYLKSNLTKDASRAIQHLQVTEVNYDAAWELLKKRFNNVRLSFARLMDKIFNLPQMQEESAEKLKVMHETISDCLEGIKNLGIKTTTWGPLMGHFIQSKWDSETNKLYEQSLRNPNEIQEYEQVMEFLQQRFQTMEIMAKNTNKNKGQNYGKENKVKCRYCNELHKIHNCAKFKALKVEDRKQFAKKSNLCYNCLGHDAGKTCYSNQRCEICKHKHNTMLHDDQIKRAAKHNASSQMKTGPLSSNLGTQKRPVLIATAMVKVMANDGSTELVRVLVDPGSQASFVSEQTAQMLRIPRQKVEAEVSGLGDKTLKLAKWKINVKIVPRFSNTFQLNTEALVLSKLTQEMPQKQLDANFSEWENHILADPTFNKPGPIDMILGAQEYSQIILEGIKKTESGLLGQNTEFGWIISGHANHSRTEKLEVLSMVTQFEEENQLTKFWEIEDVGTERHLSREDEKCEKLYKNSTKRNADGSYTVRIPFKEEVTELGNSKNRALSRFFQLEKKLEKDGELKKGYHKFMEEYPKLGHMKKLNKLNPDSVEYFIPHQAVIRESSSTTKLRVVFDASCKTTLGKSINELMYTGPRLQEELSEILMRWRMYQIVFMADVEKMFRQIKMHEDDQKFQQILWRWDVNKPIEEYKLTTVTYGTKAAPYLAVRTLQQLALDEESKYPEVSKILREDFYVDDVLSGGHTLEQTVQIQRDLIQLLARGGFNLRKWSSNKKETLQNLPQELQDVETLEIANETTKKSLGIYWAPIDDTFTFKVTQAEATKITKRHILSEISKLFDPLGWLSPVIIRAKMLIQEIWLQKLHWDQEVPEEIKKKWLAFEEQLKSIEEIKIERWIRYNREEVEMSLHGFCDASEKAYGCVVYCKAVNTNTGTTTITLLTAKSKVAPIRTKTTLPRLELCAAVLLAKLLKKIRQTLKIDIPKTYAWSDSMIVLAWINGDTNRWKTFVANRVAEITKILPSDAWKHVKTEENPVDLVSRGVEPAKLKNNEFWFHGPVWLKENIADQQQSLNLSTTKMMEEKLCLQTTVEIPENELISRFSNWTRMLRVLTLCFRFGNKCRKNAQISKNLKVGELEETMTRLVKVVQSSAFKEDITSLRKHKQTKHDSKLSSLSPFIDDKQILRVGGRLKNSHLPYNEKHPIIIPARSHLAQLIIANAHEMTLHGGTQVTLAFIRRKFWIINGKKEVGIYIRRCTRCVRFREKTSEQLMGQLPAPRVTPSSPFLYSGVDFAGPISIRTTKGRGNKSYKGYICVFVCLATKAIHLEAVSDMTTNTFLSAFRRFTARRGYCAHIYSDNGTTFVGADKLIEKACLKIIQQNEVQDILVSRGTQWHFIPPAAPHFGGIWEAGVKSMKHHLKRIIGEATLTFEEITTLLCQIEACLNSRPLCPMPDNDSDFQVLTPGHFLIGREMISQPDIVSTDIDINITFLPESAVCLN